MKKTYSFNLLILIVVLFLAPLPQRALASETSRPTPLLRQTSPDKGKASERTIYFDNIPNARQLGGIVTTDGHRVKTGLLFRCGVLAKASDADINRLVNEFHIRHIVDFRTAFEVGRETDRFVPHTSYMNLPINDEDNNFWMTVMRMEGNSFAEKIVHFAFLKEAKEEARKLYTGYVSDEFCQIQFATFLHTLANLPDGDPMLWHCSQGKDRTAVAAALLLFALGCDRATVVADFDYSNAAYHKAVEQACQQVRNMGGSDEEERVVATLIGVTTPYFEEALDLIDSKYGSMDSYIRNILQISEEEINTLKNRYLE